MAASRPRSPARRTWLRHIAAICEPHAATRPSTRLLLIALAVATVLTSPRPAAAVPVAYLVDTLGSCVAGTGGVGPTIGNFGAQGIPRDVGFRFTTPSSGRYRVDQITVCVATEDATYAAPFAIYTDMLGAPGAVVATFDVTVSTTKGFASAMATQDAVLGTGASYWLVAERDFDRGTWYQLNPTEAAMQAKRLYPEVVWEVDVANVPQLRVRGVPEPDGAPGAWAAGAGLWLLRRRSGAAGGESRRRRRRAERRTTRR